MCAYPTSTSTSSVRPHLGHQPYPSTSGGSRGVSSSISSSISDPGYALMRQHRKRANEFLTRALEIDESGHGEKHL